MVVTGENVIVGDAYDVKCGGNGRYAGVGRWVKARRLRRSVLIH